jgi:uncharacterized protein YjiS (DUF1127 family)
MQATLTPTRTGFDPAAALADGWQALRRAAAERLRSWHAAHEHRQTERALRRLSPWLRRDLGLEPSDIPSTMATDGGHGDTPRRLWAQF